MEARDLRAVVLKKENDQPPRRRVLPESFRLLRLDPDERGSVVLGLFSGQPLDVFENHGTAVDLHAEVLGGQPRDRISIRTDHVGVDDDALDDDLLLNAVQPHGRFLGERRNRRAVQKQTQRSQDARAHTRTAKRRRPMHGSRLTQESQRHFL